MTKRLIIAGICLATIATTAIAQTNETIAWRQDFQTMPRDWRVKTKPLTPPAKFFVVTNETTTNTCLNMTADKASAAFVTQLKDIDLNKTPILRWRWRVATYPTGADGRDPAKDDQAIGIYVNEGNMLGQRSIAYRWETVTPVGSEGGDKYANGIIEVHWIALRCQTNSADGLFYTEERNVAADFQRVYGYIPEKIGIGISCNSQYTKSQAEAQLEWIELVAE